MLPGAHKSLW